MHIRPLPQPRHHLQPVQPCKMGTRPYHLHSETHPLTPLRGSRVHVCDCLLFLVQHTLVFPRA